MRYTGRLAGIFAEPAAATAVAGLRRAVAEGRIGRRSSAVALITGNGLKDVQSARQAAGRPYDIAPDGTALEEILLERKLISMVRGRSEKEAAAGKIACPTTMAYKLMHTSLLIRDIHTLVTMDAEDRVLHGGYIYAENGEIRRVGSGTAKLPKADRVIDGRHAVVLPGLVNTHHHLYQTLTRAYAPAADAKLFDWLRTLYPIWARVDEECVHVAALAGMAELLLSGCTTTSDHHYLFPRGRAELIDAQIEAARRIGMRFHPTRGSMSVGRSKGGLPPDSVVQNEARILQDCERLIAKYHDAEPGSMLRLALAPCSPFSVSPELMRASADLARRHGVRLHTHLAETRDEDAYCLSRFGKRPLDLLEEVGMAGRRYLAGARRPFQPRRSEATGPRGRGDCALSHFEHAAGFGHRAGARATPRRMSGGSRRGRQRFQRQLAHAGGGSPGAAVAARAVWGGGADGARCLADGHGGRRALPGPRRHRQPGARQTRRRGDVRSTRRCVQWSGRRRFGAVVVRAGAGGHAGGGRARRGGGRRAANHLAGIDSAHDIAGLPRGFSGTCS